jgi:hypothetical protein
MDGEEPSTIDESQETSEESWGVVEKAEEPSEEEKETTVYETVAGD